MATATSALPSSSVLPPQTLVDQVETKNKENVLFNNRFAIAAIVTSIAAAALSAFAFVNGLLDSAIALGSRVFTVIGEFALRSPLHATGLVVGSVLVIGLAAAAVKGVQILIERRNAAKDQQPVQPKTPDAEEAPTPEAEKV